MDERLQFVDRRLAGGSMAELCREFGICRKSGYKIFDRDQECGLQGLTDRSRRPYRYANQLPFPVENFLLNVKREHHSKIPSAQKCYPCSRYVLLPMCPGWTGEGWWALVDDLRTLPLGQMSVGIPENWRAPAALILTGCANSKASHPDLRHIHGIVDITLVIRNAATDDPRRGPLPDARRDVGNGGAPAQPRQTPSIQSKSDMLHPRSGMGADLYGPRHRRTRVVPWNNRE